MFLTVQEDGWAKKAAEQKHQRGFSSWEKRRSLRVSVQPTCACTFLTLSSHNPLLAPVCPLQSLDLATLGVEKSQGRVIGAAEGRRPRGQLFGELGLPLGSPMVGGGAWFYPRSDSWSWPLPCHPLLRFPIQFPLPGSLYFSQLGGGQPGRPRSANCWGQPQPQGQVPGRTWSSSTCFRFGDHGIQMWAFPLLHLELALYRVDALCRWV